MISGPSARSGSKAKISPSRWSSNAGVAARLEPHRLAAAVVGEVGAPAARHHRDQVEPAPERGHVDVVDLLGLRGDRCALRRHGRGVDDLDAGVVDGAAHADRQRRLGVDQRVGDQLGDARAGPRRRGPRDRSPRGSWTPRNARASPRADSRGGRASAWSGAPSLAPVNGIGLTREWGRHSRFSKRLGEYDAVRHSLRDSIEFQQGVFDDLGHRGVDPVLTACHSGDWLPRLMRLDERLEQQARLRTDDVRAEQLLTVAGRPAASRTARPAGSPSPSRRRCRRSRG